MVLLITSAVTFLMVGVWRNSGYLLEAALARTTAQKLLRSTQGLLTVAIELANENYAVLISGKKEIRMPIPSWFTYANKKYNGLMIFAAQEDALLVRALLQEQDAICCALRATVCVQKVGRSIIRDWSIDTTA